MEGDSPWHALDVWADNILRVTAWELRFWPFWSASQFCLVPNSFQVIFASFGSLLWNCYISFTALQEPLDRAQVRIGVKVDGVSSPLQKSPFRRYVGASPMQSSPSHNPMSSPGIPPIALNLADDLVDAAESAAFGRRDRMLHPPTGSVDICSPDRDRCRHLAFCIASSHRNSPDRAASLSTPLAEPALSLPAIPEPLGAQARS